MIAVNDQWSDAEKIEGEAYRTLVSQTILDALVKLSPPQLPPDKRAQIYVEVFMAAAARMAAHELQMNADEFAANACDTFMKI